MKSILFGLLLLLMVGCSANALPTPTSAPAPFSTTVPSPAAPSPTSVSPRALTNEDILATYPLKKGAQWVYRQEAYAPNENEPGQTITATLAITDTVVETQAHDSSYAAQVVRESEIVSASISIDLMSDEAKTLFLGDQPATKWYVVTGDRIYWTYDPLDWTATDQFTLAYKFPLADGACWSIEPNSSKSCQASDYQLNPVSRIVEKLDTQQTPAGDFTNCFMVSELYNSGPTIERFCLGVGIVGEDFDHSGTKFGSHSQLIKFTPGN